MARIKAVISAEPQHPSSASLCSHPSTADGARSKYVVHFSCMRSISQSSGIALARRLVACISLSVKNETVLSLFPAACAARSGSGRSVRSEASLCTLRRGRPLGWCHSCVSPWLPSGSRARSCEMSATELPGFDPRRCRPGRGQALQLELLWAWVLSLLSPASPWARLLQCASEFGTRSSQPCMLAARAASWPWTWVPGDRSLDGTLPRPGLPCSSGLRNSRP